MPNTINIVQPKAEDGVTEVSFVTRTNSIYKSDGSPLGDSLDAYMDKVDELSQNLAELEVFSKTYSDTTATWTNVLQDFYSSLTASAGYMALSDSQKMSLKVAVNNDIYNVTYNDGSSMIIGCVQNNGSGTILNRTMFISGSTRNYSRITITSAGAITHTNYTTQGIGSAQTLKVLR